MTSVNDPRIITLDRIADTSSAVARTISKEAACAFPPKLLGLELGRTALL